MTKNKDNMDELLKHIDSMMIELSGMLCDLPRGVEVANHKWVDIVERGEEEGIQDYLFEYSSTLARVLLLEKNLKSITGAIVKIGDFCREEDPKIKHSGIPGISPLELYEQMKVHGTRHKFDPSKSEVM